MIIFGTRTLESTRETGTFFCPRCSMDRGYQRKSMNRWFTLYFIPVIPMGSAGEYILCGSCGGTYGVEVLSYNPEVDRAELAATFRRLLVLVMISARKTGAEHIAALRTIVNEAFATEPPESQIYEDIQQAHQAQASLTSFTRTATSDFTDDGKVMVMQAAFHVISSNGFLTEPDKDILRQFGQAMGFPRKDIQQFLASEKNQV